MKNDKVLKPFSIAFLSHQKHTTMHILNLTTAMLLLDEPF